MSVGADEVGESVMASIAATCILVCHRGRRLARGRDWGHSPFGNVDDRLLIERGSRTRFYELKPLILLETADVIICALSQAHTHEYRISQNALKPNI